MKKISRFALLPVGLSVALLAVGTASVVAQPDPENAPKANNPANRAVGANKQGRQQLTPEQRAERMQNRLKRELERFGVTDATVQQAVLDYIKGETEARDSLSEKGRALQQGLRGDALTDTQVMAQLHDYNASIDDDKARRTSALQQLNKLVDFTKNPKLEAYLTIMGFIGDGPSLMGGGGQRGGGGQGNNFGGAGNANGQGNANGGNFNGGNGRRNNGGGNPNGQLNF